MTKTFLGIAAVAGIAVAAAILGTPSTNAQGTVREVAVGGDHFAFSPARIEVQKDDIVKVTFTAVDIPHSFNMDGPYRVAKRAGAGQTVTFEFRATGNATFYCSLTQDERCKNMRGELIVK